MTIIKNNEERKIDKLMSEIDKLESLLRDIKIVKFNWTCDCKDCKDIKERIEEIK